MTRNTKPQIRHKVLMLSWVIFTTALAACTWVRTTPQADQVRIVPADRVLDCTSVGNISTYTKTKFVGVNRKATKVAQELESLGRLEAVEMGADTIVSDGEIVDGRMNFIAYRCQE